MDRGTGEGRGGAPRFSAANVALLGGGLAALGVGYGLLAGGSTVAGPLALVLGYAVLLPWSLSH